MKESILKIKLPEVLKTFVETEVQLRGYKSPGEYLRELLRQAKERRDQEEQDTKLLQTFSETLADMQSVQAVIKELPKSKAPLELSALG